MSNFRSSTNFVELNGGTVGGGGTRKRKSRPFGLAVLTHTRVGGFEPIAADLVEIDAKTGSARAGAPRSP